MRWFDLIRPIVDYPNVSRRYGNGEIPISELTLIHPRLGAQGYLAPVPALAYSALVQAAKDNGFNLTITGAYRPLSAQTSEFIRRYEPTNLPLPGRKLYNGRFWRLKLGNAPVATPGKSNHGKGIAVDFALISADGKTVPLNVTAINWLTANAPDYGFYPELKSEVWHWRYLYGDHPSPKFSAPGPDFAAIAAFIAEARKSTLKRGDSGPFVKLLQERLHITADSQFGPSTEATLKTFQTFVGLPATGTTDPHTWAALFGEKLA